jgi:hypothetical protein
MDTQQPLLLKFSWRDAQATHSTNVGRFGHVRE